MWKKILIGLACIVLAGLLAFGIQKSMQEDAARSAALREVNQQMDALRTRRKELETELETQKEKFETELRGMGTFTVLVTDLSVGLMDQVAQALKEADVPGVMALAQDRFPGDEGLIPLSDFLQRLEDGWEYCVVYDGSAEFDEWYRNMSELLTANGLTMPRALYCAGRYYTEEIEEAAKNHGFETIVYSGEQGQTDVDTESVNPWHVDSVRWIVAGSRSRMEEAANSSGSLAFTVDAANFSESEFNSMLRLVNQYRDEGTLMAATFSNARTYRAGVISELEAARKDPEYNAAIAALQEELDSVDEQIQALIES